MLVWYVQKPSCSQAKKTTRHKNSPKGDPTLKDLTDTFVLVALKVSSMKLNIYSEVTPGFG